MFNMTSFIKPSIALDLIRKQLTKNCGFPVYDFEIHYNPAKNDLFFVILKRKYMFDNNMIQSLLRSQLKEYQTKIKDIIYLKVCAYSLTNYILIYYIDNGTKRFLKHLL